MSAMPAQLGLVRPPDNRGSWFPIDEAARLMGKTRTTLLRRCHSEWAEQGSARLMPVAIGGKKQWHIHARVDARLVRAAVEATPTGESAVHVTLAAATRAHRDEAARKAGLVVAFRAWKSTLVGTSVRDAYPAFLATQQGAPSFTQMKEWSSRCPTSEDLPGCMAAMLETRGRPREGAPGMSEPAFQLYLDEYLTKQRPSHSKCWRAVRAVALERGWTWPSEDTVARIRDQRLTQSQIDMARLGQDEWAKIHKTPIEQHPDAWIAGQCWEGDNSQLDFFVRVWKDGEWKAVRPLLSCWKDRRSRRIMGWHLSDRANSTTIRLAFVSAAQAEGVGLPEHVWIDNGKDFKSQALTGVTKAQRRKMTAEEIAAEQTTSTALFCMLNVRAHFAVEYNHNGKPKIERQFGFVHQDFDREYRSWCGSDRGDRPDEDHLRETVKDVMGLPTLEQVRADFGAWVAWFNARSEHAIHDLVVVEDGAPRRLSPVEYYERFLPTRRVAQAETLELLRMPFEPRAMAVSKRGVRVMIDHRPFWYGGGHPALEAMVGTDQRVYVSYDDADRSQVTVYDQRFRRVCVAKQNEMLGGGAVPTEAVKAAIRRQRQQAARAKQRTNVLDAVLKPGELASKIAREADVAATRERLREAGHVEASASANVRLVGTPIDAAARQVQARKAVGSDADDMPAEGSIDVLMDIARASGYGGDNRPASRPYGGFKFAPAEAVDEPMAPAFRFADPTDNPHDQAEDLPGFRFAPPEPEEDTGVDVLKDLYEGRP